LIGRSEHDRQKMSVRPRRGRTAVTHYRTVETFKECSLLRIRIETGRTHQIRVHMKHMGLPVIGDARYGRGRRRRSDGLSAARQMLHAERLVLSHPRTGERMEFRAPLPADMTATLEALRTGSRVRSSTAGPD
jgi:23S rRNA pseudouridine1911/1915/1917 synthase